jgi:hypothetical protein
VSARGSLDDDTATALGHQALAGCASVMLASQASRDWLLIVEYAEAVPRDALRSHGWLAQEVLVKDVDALAAALDESPFTVLRPPANLDVSDYIRACQVRGPAGEVLYLTQVKAEVPPFQLPRCMAPVDHLFIPVLSTPDRDASLRDYEALAAAQGMRFETRISVVNQAMGLPLEQRHAVGTLQLAGDSLIEIDQIGGAVPAPAGICEGTLAVVFQAAGNAPPQALRAERGPFAGLLLLPFTGSAGEHAVLAFRH